MKIPILESRGFGTIIAVFSARCFASEVLVPGLNLAVRGFSNWIEAIDHRPDYRSPTTDNHHVI